KLAGGSGDGVAATPGGAAATPSPEPPASFTLEITFSEHGNPSLTMPAAPTALPGTPTPASTTGSNISIGGGGRPTAAATNRPPATPSATRTPRPTPRPGPYAVGGTGTTEGLWVTLNSVHRPAAGYHPPPSGMEYVTLNVTIENLGDKTQNVSTERTFS